MPWRKRKGQLSPLFQEIVEDVHRAQELTTDLEGVYSKVLDKIREGATPPRPGANPLFDEYMGKLIKIRKELADKLEAHARLLRNQGMTIEEENELRRRKAV